MSATDSGACRPGPPGRRDRGGRRMASASVGSSMYVDGAADGAFAVEPCLRCAALGRTSPDQSELPLDQYREQAAHPGRSAGLRRARGRLTGALAIAHLGGCCWPCVPWREHAPNRISRSAAGARTALVIMSSPRLLRWRSLFRGGTPFDLPARCPSATASNSATS